MMIYNFLFLFFIMNICISCIGYRGDVIRSQRLNISKIESVRLVFTGFSKYETESKTISGTLKEMGYHFDPTSPMILEVVLEEENPKYKYKFLHFVNLISSILTLTAIPYHVKSEHTLSFRFRKNGRIEREIDLNTVFHQWRGILLFPFTYFYWPSTEFDDYLKSTVIKGLAEK